MADPMTLMALSSVGSSILGGFASAAGKSSTSINLPAAAPPVQSPVGDQSTAATNTNPGARGGPSFLAAAAAPNVNQTAGTKTLLGQ